MWIFKHCFVLFRYLYGDLVIVDIKSLEDKRAKLRRKLNYVTNAHFISWSLLNFNLFLSHVQGLLIV